MTHTPGPWRTGAGNFGRILAGHSMVVAETHTDDTFGEREELSNAQLIAAAPDLLAAAEWLCVLAHEESQNIYMGGNIERAAQAYHLHKACTAVKAALAKARGPVTTDHCPMCNDTLQGETS